MECANFFMNAEFTPLLFLSTSTLEPIFITILLASASKFFRKSLIFVVYIIYKKPLAQALQDFLFLKN
jgi:hypothetical protein